MVLGQHAILFGFVLLKTHFYVCYTHHSQTNVGGLAYKTNVEYTMLFNRSKVSDSSDCKGMKHVEVTSMRIIYNPKVPKSKASVLHTPDEEYHLGLNVDKIS